MSSEIIPTIFSATKKEFNERFEKVRKISKSIHIDFMDGKFVKSKSISLKDIPNLSKYRNSFEAHLMTANPEKWIKPLKRKGFKKIIFHYESIYNEICCMIVINQIKNARMIPFMAINPETGIGKVTHFLHSLGGVLIMGVHPGKEHQEFINRVYEKISELRKFSKKAVIQVDGGINPGNIKKLRKEGVNLFNSGSFISGADNPKEALGRLRKAFI